MNYKNYEAWDKENDFCIYNGSSKSAMIYELKDYIEYENHIDEHLISEEEIENLYQKALKVIGIKVYING